MSRDGRASSVVAARHRDFVVVTDRRVMLWSCGFFTRRPRRRVLTDRRDDLMIVDIGSTAAPTIPRACVRRASRYGSSSGATRGAGRSSTSCSGGGTGVTTVIAIDAGTTGVRAFAVDEHGRPHARAYREFPQHFPQPGWVEHDADDIWRVTLETLAEVGRAGRARRRDRDHQPARDGDRVGPSRRARHATARSCGRTAAPRSRCDELRAAGHEPLVRRQTGLVLDPYFSATKLEWLLRDGGVEADADLAVRHGRHVDPLEPHRRRRRRRARDRPVEREPHDVVRHRHARLVRRAVHAVRRAACVPAGRAPVERPLRRRRRRSARPGSRCR